MEDEPATGFDDVATAPDGQADETNLDTAENDQTQTQTDSSTDAERTTEELSDDNLTWAQKKGVNLDDKAAVAKMLRESDRKVSETALKAKTSLQKAVDQTNAPDEDADAVTELRQQYRQLETKFAATQYYLDNPDDKEFDMEASTILQETLITDSELARGLGRNLPALFALAKQRHQESTVAAAKDEGRKEERKAQAGKQRASATSRAATTSSDSSKDPFEEGFDNPWSAGKRS